MSRPSEGLGDAFSCRLTSKLDREARSERMRNGTPLSAVVRGWLEHYHQLLGTVQGTDLDASWETRYYRIKARLGRLTKRLKKATGEDGAVAVGNG